MSATSIEQIQHDYQFQYQNESQSHHQFGHDYVGNRHDVRHHRRTQSFPISTTAVNTIDSPVISFGITKSNNGGGSLLKLKSTMLVRDDSNGRINTSLTSESDSEQGHASNCSLAIPNECDAFIANGSSGYSSRRARGSIANNKNNSLCYRVKSFIKRNWYLSYIIPLTILFALMFFAYLTRNYAKELLFWIENQNSWVIFAVFMLLFIIVSFPVVVGYFVLMITSGYLFGCVKGFFIVVLGANMGIAVAHFTIKSCKHRIPIHKIIKNETGRAILRVISGPKAFKVVLFTRLTPIPFGLQNAIFGVSSINTRVYHTATFLGLLPAQSINVYLGSTLRSMHEVLNNHGTAVTGYISFGVEVVCGVALMFWVVQKARTELSETLIADISADGRIIDIQV